MRLLIGEDGTGPAVTEAVVSTVPGTSLRVAMVADRHAKPHVLGVSPQPVDGRPSACRQDVMEHSDVHGAANTRALRRATPQIDPASGASARAAQRPQRHLGYRYAVLPFHE